MNETSKEDWALYHLKYEEYSKSLAHYIDITTNQNNFNNKMDKFLTDCKARLIAIISANNEKDQDKIEILLKKYLSTVVYVYNRSLAQLAPLEKFLKSEYILIVISNLKCKYYKI
jgi:hypothetical protein